MSYFVGYFSPNYNVKDKTIQKSTLGQWQEINTKSMFTRSSEGKKQYLTHIFEYL